MSRQGAGTSVPAPLAYPGACWAGLLGVPVGGGPAAVLPVLWAWPLSVPVGGGPPARSPHASCARSGRSRGPPWPRRRRPAPRPGPATAHGHRSRTLRTLRRPPRQWCLAAVVPPVGIAGVSRAVISGRSFACCYKRRQLDVFFVWVFDPLLQTSSIRRLFRRK